MEIIAHGKSIDTSPLTNVTIQGEANVDGATFVLPLRYKDIDLSGLTYVIKAVNSKDNLIEQTLHKKVSATDIRLDWIITGDYTTASGMVSLELIGVDSTNTTIIKFYGDTIFVAPSPTGTYAPPKETLEKALLDVQLEVSKAMGYADSATLSEAASTSGAVKAKASEEMAGLKATESEASATKAKASENNAKVSETNAKTSETVSSKALSDLLKMIGVDIATLVGGKIPMEQIPATATQEIYTITNASELTTLVAQKGDLAELIEVVNGERTITKSWQLLTNDPTVLTNWVVWGTSYAVQAGNANTAITAENATMINNHRMAEMSQADFAVAVKDPNTYYLVK